MTELDNIGHLLYITAISFPTIPSRETRKKSLSFHQSVKHHINIIPCLCFWVALPNTSAGDRIRSTHKLDLPSRLPGWDSAYRRLSEGKLPTTNARSFIVSSLKVVNGRMLRRGLAEFFFRAVMIFFGLVVLSLLSCCIRIIINLCKDPY